MKPSVLKAKVYDDGVKVLQHYNYKGNKSKCAFTNKNNNRSIELTYEFNNYIPIKIEFYFTITIKYFHLLQELKKFYQKVSPDEPIKWNVFQLEGFFCDEMKNATSKEKVAYKNQIYSENDVDFLINKSGRLLESKVLPFLKKIDDEESFQKYISTNPSFIIEHIIDIELFNSSLLVIKLFNEANLKSLIEFIEDFLFDQKAKGYNYKRNFEYLNLFKSFYL